MLFSCAPERKEFAYYLENGKIREGVDMYSNLFSTSKDTVTDTQKLEFALLQLCRAFEKVSGDFYEIIDPKYYQDVKMPPNNNTREVTFEEFYGMIDEFYKTLETTEALLKEIKDKNINLKLYAGKYYLDINNNGQREEWEWLPNIFRPVMPMDSFSKEKLEQFYIGFDYSDVLWLRGYCNFMMHHINFILTYDWEYQFYLYLTNQPIAKIPESKKIEWFRINPFLATTVPVKDASRMKKAYEQILEVFRLSRETWAAIKSETDNDQEWLPQPRQQGVFFNIPITDELVDSWHVLLNNGESFLRGDRHIPYKLDQGLYINLYKYYHNPKEIDLSKIIMNLDDFLKPYLENGPVITAEEQPAGLLESIEAGLAGEDSVLRKDFWSITFFFN